MDGIDISKYNKADVLVALYNNSKPLGLGFLHFDPVPMTREEAASLLEIYTYFDYLKGRVMKVELSGDIFLHFYMTETMDRGLLRLL